MKGSKLKQNIKSILYFRTVAILLAQFVFSRQPSDIRSFFLNSEIFLSQPLTQLKMSSDPGVKRATEGSTKGKEPKKSRGEFDPKDEAKPLGR